MNHKLKRITQILVALILTAAVTGISSCEKYSFTLPKIDPEATLHFQTDIQPIFNANCLTCHGAIKAPDLREGKSYQALTNGGYVNPPAESSKLYLKITGPDHAPRSTDVDKQKVLIWITQGALNN
jgi:type 1 glutamine amidotransferase